MDKGKNEKKQNLVLLICQDTIEKKQVIDRK